MKAIVTVTLKPDVLDPQGQAIQKACASLGHDGIQSVRQGKIFEIELDAKDEASANALLDELGDKLLANTVIDEASIGAGCRIGPYARLRPGTTLADEVHIGNFVEVKKSDIDAGSKVNHLAYVGDAEVGQRVNVGAGTITCNYDGAFKHKTILEDDVFVGSDTQLVAPVRVGRGVTIGAGTTVTDDVEADRLVISRVRQKTISGYKRPRKDKT